MPRTKLDGMLNRRFGRLVVVAQAPFEGFKTRWLCRCDCGKETIRRGAELRYAEKRGRATSCGCHAAELRRANGWRPFPKDHGMSATPIHNRWSSMLSRCQNPNADGYANYGGRGVKVCDRWLDFKAFYADMGNPPTGKHSLDRIDSSGDYEPNNVRWATRHEQSRNRRTNVYLTARGETKILLDWATHVGVRRELIASRLRRGWTTEDAIFTPPRPVTIAE